MSDHKSFAADGKTRLINIYAYPLMVEASEFNKLVGRIEQLERDRDEAITQFEAPPPPAVPEGWADALNLARNTVGENGKQLSPKGESVLAGAIIAMEELRLTAAPQSEDKRDADIVSREAIAKAWYSLGVDGKGIWLADFYDALDEAMESSK